MPHSLFPKNKSTIVNASLCGPDYAVGSASIRDVYLSGSVPRFYAIRVASTGNVVIENIEFNGYTLKDVLFYGRASDEKRLWTFKNISVINSNVGGLFDISTPSSNSSQTNSLIIEVRYFCKTKISLIFSFFPFGQQPQSKIKSISKIKSTFENRIEFEHQRFFFFLRHCQ